MRTNDDLERERDELDALWADLSRSLRSFLDESTLLASLRWQRVRLAAREWGFRLLFAAWLVVAGATASIVGAVYLLVGVARMAADLAGGPTWVGALVAGLLGTAIVPLGVLVGLRAMERRFARRLHERYGEPSGNSLTTDGAKPHVA